MELTIKINSTLGMQTNDGKTGYHIEHDERSGAHINVWSGKKTALPFRRQSTNGIAAKRFKK
ncbi:hypothetical protein [Pseudomonas palleroniana]|uniref:hypothetical protein n=1 Tax=Pseudomonas palleroniana TaxID=191390 RepID=UPI0018E66461|nr:hypothetical protein [Pseudomonas palleroniana]MBI6909316.1 hypothetical protein [Pseudomonas palleroniana]